MPNLFLSSDVLEIVLGLPMSPLLWIEGRAFISLPFFYEDPLNRLLAFSPFPFPPSDTETVSSPFMEPAPPPFFFSREWRIFFSASCLGTPSRRIGVAVLVFFLTEVENATFSFLVGEKGSEPRLFRDISLVICVIAQC